MKYKTTIVIYSEFDPMEVELEDLTREATEGAAICDGMKAVQVPDSDLPEGVAEFFSDAQ